MSWVPEEVPPELKDAIHKKIHRNCKSWTYTVCLWVPEEVPPELKDAIHQKMHRNCWSWTCMCMGTRGGPT
jgi:hypothetical protein